VAALDFLRDDAGLKGVKHACREGDCGSCVVLLGRLELGRLTYRAVTSCLLPLGAVENHHVVTVEGLAMSALSPFQQALADSGGSQCGFCTPGFVVSFAGHLLETADWSLDGAVEAIAGNICRCTGYASIERAMAEILGGLEAAPEPGLKRIEMLIERGLLPAYFSRIPDLLAGFQMEDSLPDVAPERVVISGGTDLFVQRPDELDEHDVAVIVPPASTEPIRRDDDEIILAGTATAEDLKRSALLAETVGDLQGAMRLMGSLPIRHRATIAGNLVNASPIGDMTIILLALDADLELVTGGTSRRLPINHFFLGYKTLDLQPGELIRKVRFTIPGDGHRFNFEKVSKRTHLDIASVNTALSIVTEDGVITDARLTAGGVAPIPLRLAKAPDATIGREPNGATAMLVATTAADEVSPITDVRGSADYKRLLLKQLVLAHFLVLFDLEDQRLLGEAS
jgi:xanthine dehydrogenase small subunit